MKRNREQLLSHAAAEQILSNVFMACEREPNSVPLEALTAYSNYRKERYSLQRTVIALMLALFLLLPLLFFAAGVRVELKNPNSAENPVYSVKVDSHIPIRQIEARLGDRTVPLYEVSPGEYTVIPLTNGELRISVTLVNRQATTAGVSVEGADHDAPELLSTEIGDDAIYFYLSDAGVGVDYAGITIEDPAGRLSGPLHWDAANGCVAMPYPKEALHVSIPDLRGNVLEIHLKPQG